MAKMKIEFVINKDYNPVFVTGAIGGMNTNGQILTHFYTDHNHLPISEILEVNEDGSVTGRSFEMDPAKNTYRLVKVGIMMNLNSAVEYHKWLGNQIEIAKQTLQTLQAHDNSSN